MFLMLNNQIITQDSSFCGVTSLLSLLVEELCCIIVKHSEAIPVLHF